MKMTINSKISAKNLKPKSVVKMLALSLAIIFAVGCDNTEEKTAGNSNASNKVVAEEKKKDDFVERLNSVRTGNFDFILAFRRPDGEVLSGDDKKFLKANSPNDTNQWVLTADGKTAIAGSNYKFLPPQLDILKKRFVIQDYSPKTIDGNGNQNLTNQNLNGAVIGSK